MTTGISFDFVISEKDLESKLWALDTALNPIAIAGFLGAEVDPYIRTRARQRFRDEGDDVSGKWAPLHEATWQWRSNIPGISPEHPINRRTGELEEYVTQSRSDVNYHGVGAVLKMPGDRPTGELKDKVTTAQAGRADPNTQPRPVIGMNERDLTAVMTLLFLYIAKASQRRKP